MKPHAIWALAAWVTAVAAADPSPAPAAPAPAATAAPAPTTQTATAAPASPAAAAAATEAKAEAPLQVREDHHAWVAAPFFLQKHMGSKEGGILPAGALVRVKEESVAGTQHWRHLKAGNEDGWAIAPNLTAVRPAGLADTLVPMLGDRSGEIALIRTNMDSQDLKTRIATYKSLHLSGITDEALFDEIAHRFAAGMAQSSDASKVLWGKFIFGGLIGQAILDSAKDKNVDLHERAQTMPWQARALATSGYAKYWRILDEAAADTSFASYHIDDHAEVAIGELDQYAVWNRIINSPDNRKDGRPDEEVRTINMLKSGIRVLQKESLKRIKDAGATRPELYDEVEAQLLPASTADFSADHDAEDAAALMTTALASTTNAKYVPTLQKVSAETKSEKLKKYADKALMQLQGPPKK